MSTPLTQLLVKGDCIETMKSLPDASIDAVVCDPPYGLEFLGKERDAPWKDVRTDTRGVIDPKKWGGTQDGPSGGNPYSRARIRTAAAHYGGDAAEVGRAFQAWCLLWTTEALRVLKPGGYLLAFGGTRTYHRLAVAIEDAGFTIRDCLGWQYGSGFPKSHNGPWGGTALKPAWEPVVVARKPLEGTVAANERKHGTGGMNIDGCRADEGRWPANILLSHTPDCTVEVCVEGCPCAAMDAQSDGASRYFNRLPIEEDDLVPFIYAAKASRKERNAGLPEGTTCTHPTVKPISIMRHLVRLVTRKGGVVLDPFVGSGTTGIAAVLEGVNFIGIDLSEEYIGIATARIRHAGGTPEVTFP
jgi:site-specific DNA-methyltransferase (adenine-specific)